GAEQFRALLAEAAPLADVLWATEVARVPLDTPERRADLHQRLRQHLNHVGDRDVRRFYAEDFRAREERLFQTRAAAPAARRGGRPGFRFGRRVDPEEEAIERHRK